MMRLKSLLASLLLTAVLTVSAVPAAPRNSSKTTATTAASIRAVLAAQVAAWNRGDIAGYMDGYARSADTLFISGDSITRGWQTVFERYQKRYDSREKMGTLTFADVEIKPISHNSAVALGSWHLQRAQDAPHGKFTLIFRRTRHGWKIVHDHTSSA